MIMISGHGLKGDIASYEEVSSEKHEINDKERVSAKNKALPCRDQIGTL